MDENVPGFIGWIGSGSGRIPRVSSAWRVSDHVGAWKVRWGMGRMSYLVPAGLYAVGSPCPEDPVVVTANYKMSYDLVRRALSGRDLWLLVLETHGVNVWCAAGKGTFGTGELVYRIRMTGLSDVVSHRKLLLPVLGATGVAAHEVERQTGFAVSYATIRIADLPEYLDNGMTTTPAMRELTFRFRERLALVPVELVLAMKKLLIACLPLFLLAASAYGLAGGVLTLVAFLGAALAGIVVAPLLLPWLPGRSFSLKGALAGFVWAAVFLALCGIRTIGYLVISAAFLALPAVSAYYTLNFTGCTNFTSHSGVKKEMSIALPIICGVLALAVILLCADWMLRLPWRAQ